MAKEFSAKDFKQSILDAPRERAPNPLLMANRIIDRVRDGFKEYGCKHRDEIIAAGKDAYFELTGGINIPLVPEAAEVQIKENLWNSYIEPLLQGVAESVCGPKTGAST